MIASMSLLRDYINATIRFRELDGMTYKSRPANPLNRKSDHVQPLSRRHYSNRRDYDASSIMSAFAINL